MKENAGFLRFYRNKFIIFHRRFPSTSHHSTDSTGSTYLKGFSSKLTAVNRRCIAASSCLSAPKHSSIE